MSLSCSKPFTTLPILRNSSTSVGACSRREGRSCFQPRIASGRASRQAPWRRAISRHQSFAPCSQDTAFRRRCWAHSRPPKQMPVSGTCWCRASGEPRSLWAWCRPRCMVANSSNACFMDRSAHLGRRLAKRTRMLRCWRRTRYSCGSTALPPAGDCFPAGEIHDSSSSTFAEARLATSSPTTRWSRNACSPRRRESRPATFTSANA